MLRKVRNKRNQS